jgi:hypothetical protein
MELKRTVSTIGTVSTVGTISTVGTNSTPAPAPQHPLHLSTSAPS